MALLAVAGGLAQHWKIASAFDRVVLDTTVRVHRDEHPQPARIDPVIVGIDEAFLDSVEEPLTLNHVYLSRFLRAMAQAHPRVIGIDLVLPEKRFQTLALAAQPDLDFHKTLLAALLSTSRDIPIVAAKVWDKDRHRFRDIQVDYAAVLATQESGAASHASAEFCYDPDGRVRRYPGRDCQPGATDVTFAGEIAAAMGARREWNGLIDYQVGAAFGYVPIQQVLALAERGDGEALRRLFEGRAVLLGTVLDDIDLIALPVPLAAWRPGAQRVPGVVAHAQIVRDMLGHGFVEEPPAALMAVLPAFFALFWFGRAVIRKFAVYGIAAIVLLWLCSQMLLSGTWLPPGAMLFTGLAACTGRSALEGWRNWRERRRLGETFAGYVSPAVMSEILAGGTAAQQQGRKLTVCVLFSDIRNFTTLSEHLPAEEVVALLNRYFARMTAAVHRHGGTVDKFIGDGLMAFFGAPNALASPSQNALDASHEMLVSLAELNREFAAEQRAPLAIGIGLHTGEAVIGNVGSPERNAYTAIGDTVNTSARLEGLCKALGYPVLCSDSVARAVGNPSTLIPLGPQPLKGRSAIEVYGWRPLAQNADHTNQDAQAAVPATFTGAAPVQ
ncbi:MAG: CHASE2 domain-containing protein [Ramlibacter sp.]